MKLTNRQRDQIAGISFVLLPIIGIFLFVGIPLIVSLVLSFGHLSSFDIFDIDFTNFGSNYVRIFLEDNKYIRAVINSFVYAIGTSLIQTILSLLLAYFLSKPIKCRTMFRVILFIPYVCSVVALSLILCGLFTITENVGDVEVLIGLIKEGDITTFTQALTYLSELGHDPVEISSYFVDSSVSLLDGLQQYANSLFVASSASMWGLTASMCLIPVILFIIALIVLRKKYIIDEVMYDKIIRELKERNNG